MATWLRGYNKMDSGFFNTARNVTAIAWQIQVLPDEEAVPRIIGVLISRRAIVLAVVHEARADHAVDALKDSQCTRSLAGVGHQLNLDLLAGLQLVVERVWQ